MSRAGLLPWLTCMNVLRAGSGARSPREHALVYAGLLAGLWFARFWPSWPRPLKGDPTACDNPRPMTTIKSS